MLGSPGRATSETIPSHLLGLGLGLGLGFGLGFGFGFGFGFGLGLGLGAGAAWREAAGRCTDRLQRWARGTHLARVRVRARARARVS